MKRVRLIFAFIVMLIFGFGWYILLTGELTWENLKREYRRKHIQRGRHPEQGLD